MASGFPGRDIRGGFGFGAGSAVQMQYQHRSDGGAVIGAAGLLKRSLTEMERQQQLQHAIFLRSVKQKTHFTSPSPISPISSVDLSAASTTTASSILSSLSSASASAPFVGQGIPNSTTWSFQATIADAEIDSEKKSSMTNRLLELERQLLDDEEEEVSISGSAVTSNEWSETMEKLMSPPPPPPPMAAVPSPTTSTSSSSGSSSSCTPSSAAPSRQMLLDTATAITEGSQETAAANLAVLKRAANPRGDPDQRLTAMMVAALVSRINPVAPGSSIPLTDVCSAEHQAASHLLYEASPCFKFGLMAANLAILDATKDNPKIHIVDFDIGQGGQLASLIHAISERYVQRSPARPPPCVKITAVCPLQGNETTDLRIIGDRLAKLAERLGVGLRFRIVNGKIQELNHTTLLCEPGEALAVNFAFFLSRVADESVSTANPRDELLRRVKSLSPRIVTLVEQEMNGNTAPFATRFAEACAHFGALLESLDATAARDSTERARVEACLARKAANSIAREGVDRIERCEVYGKWRARMGMAGFNPVHLGSTVSEPVKLRLSSLRNNPGFTLKEETACLGCGWMGRVLTVASAWR
uniref:Scarecrow-like protein 8-like transcript variant X2 n=1 Tax=Cymbidium ensifolium TaxID=78740 RepID=A0A3G2CI29_CYMEN|nr:scarecrow-like protein 8-like transcript variant X2 [Cymbidium ensifolium]